MATTCARCGAKQGLVEKLSAEIGASVYYCPACKAKIEQEQRERVARIRQAADKVILTTTPKVDGYYAARYLGIESVEFVIGTGVFSEVSSSIADFFGARSSAFERKLQEAKRHALYALSYLAAERGANAVIGVDMDYAEFSGNRVALIINGTLVQLAPIAAKSKSPEPPAS
jgi:uncharacterized protein YbjQ (UPF0145 family)